MSTPLRPGVITGTRPTATGPSSVITKRTTALGSKTGALAAGVVVDIGSPATKATIVRGGKEVETPVANPERSAALLENFVPLARNTEPRSVRQTIAAGTLVTLGTAVDVEFLAPDHVTLGIFEGVHTDLRAQNVMALVPLLQDTEVTTLIGKPSADLTDADKQNLRTKLQTVNVAVDDTVPERSLGAAIVGLKTAQAFR